MQHNRMTTLYKPHCFSLCLLALSGILLVGTISMEVYAKYIKAAASQTSAFTKGNYTTVTVDSITSAAENTFPMLSDTSVTVKNDGYPVYVRVALVVTWRDADGNVYGQQPVLGTDYILSYHQDSWVYWDGYYYYCRPLSAGEKTEPLLTAETGLQQKSASPKSGYALHAAVLAETIQAVGTTDNTAYTAVMDAWSVSPTDGMEVN